MTNKEAADQLIWNLRLDFDPVGIRFVKDDADREKLPVTHRAKARITYCQFLAAARQGGHALFMEPEKCVCGNAQPVFGFRELDKEGDTKRHMKYLCDEELAWQAPQEKARFEVGLVKGIYIAPLAKFDETDLQPDLVFMMVVPYQAYHIFNDYMGGNKRANLQFFHTPNSAVCAGSVYAYKNNTANMTTMCAGSKTSGKTEMAYVNVFLPYEQFQKTVEQQKWRVETMGGPSVLGKGGQQWPGLDACKGCPLFKFEEVK
ncbi:DUF169 domain-containing protein [Dethiosulfatarculus sandiegensis]|uniref:DUF169 domain-containing protein n=1 Tax=Dethiosulfatarculus sandiegensis TaxID=1429043 RepID=A0A0D2HWK0_9BACT|nr:DUF169 domain-containing protein [Dethiosulfatarculus sandiegensis]KIX14753.1 hypothetical protein X474_06320 [Dethiosulfatarculus sandiegensis]